MMNRVRTAGWLVVLGCAGAVQGVALAGKVAVPTTGVGVVTTPATSEPEPPPAWPLPVPAAAIAGLVGATETGAYTLSSGFFDDAIVHDDRGLGFVATDGATRARVTVGLGTAAVPTTIDVSALTSHVVAFAADGKDVVVIGTNENEEPIAGRIDATGKVRWRVAPATAMAFVTRARRPVLAVYRRRDAPTGTRHTTEVLALASGTRVGAARTLTLDPLGKNTALDFQLGYFTDGYTRAVGIKGGKVNPKIDQRDPNTEATYDLPAGAFVAQQPILDLYAQRKRFDAVARAQGATRFIGWTQDLSGLEMWNGATRVDVTLDQSILPYDQGSLQTAFATDGTAWLALQVEPLNATAIKKKTRDAAFFDIYAVAGDGTATRRIRVPAESKRFRFGAAAHGQLWLLERNRGFDRGGTRLSILRPQ